MPQGFVFLKNIDQLVKEKVKKLGLKPSRALAEYRKENKRFYAVKCKDKEGRELFFKMLISGEAPDQERIKKEIHISQKLKNYTVPLLQYETKKMPYWLIRPYLSGPIIGYHFKIYKKGLRPKTQEQIIEILLALQKSKIRLRLNKKTYTDYLAVVKSFERIFERITTAKNKNIVDFERAYSFLKTKKPYFAKNLALAHGDFTLANFFVHQNKLYLTDWEHLRYDNMAADLARLWIQTYAYPNWRKGLLEKMLKKMPQARQALFKELFRIVVLIEAIIELRGAIDHKQLKLKKSMFNTINNSYKGFNHLMHQKI